MTINVKCLSVLGSIPGTMIGIRDTNMYDIIPFLQELQIYWER